MRVTVNRDRGVAVISTLVSLWRERSYPFDRAVLPQKLVPDSIRADRRILARFYFYACLLMRGGIESETAFRQLFKIHDLHPHLFVPEEAQRADPGELLGIIDEHIGWDKEAIARFWIENSKRLVRAWGGDPLAVFNGIATYREAIERVRNKSRKGDRAPADPRHAGFVGFQHKMTSMILYFYEWEGLLPAGFDYPPPVDFHHCRIFLGHKILTVRRKGRAHLRYDRRITDPIREFLSWYTEAHGVTTIELADTLWLYSKLMCGDAPQNTVRDWATGAAKIDQRQHSLHLPRQFRQEEWALTRKSDLIRTCGVCPVSETCAFAVPARPYFTRGILAVTERRAVGYSLRAPTPRRRKALKAEQIDLPFDDDTPERF